ncbi:MAG: carboxypeptidase-like regulatory domain-containing protein, partial [Mucilaginibacter sp.]
MSPTLTRVSLILLLFSFFAINSYGQKPLTRSLQSSYFTYIYKLEDADALNFYKYPNRDLSEKALHTIVDSFRTNSYWENKLPAGNYVKVSAEKNRLKYSLIENHSVFIKLFNNNHDQRFVLVDKLGKDITDATVKFNNRSVSFDNNSKTYHVNHSKKLNIIQAKHAGVTNFFIVKQQGYDRDDDEDNTWFTSLWTSVKKIFKKKDPYSYRYKSRHEFTGFLIFNKPIYKPHDTVKFKAFVMNAHSKKTVLQKQLLVKLEQSYRDDEKLIGKVNCYSDGGFEFSFALSDSLKLTLDEYYTIKLEDPSVTKISGKIRNNNISKDGHKILQTGRFRYEDYELKSIHFVARADKKEHQPGNPQTVYLKATDENDLPVPDGRVTLTLTSYNPSYYKSDRAFIPDTLWLHIVSLDPVGETKVVIPDSIFPKAHLSYEINADFLNSSNEHQSQDISALFIYDKFNVVTELSGDTLKTSYQEFGKEKKGVPAFISALDANGDTLSKVKAVLPSKTIINPYAKSYNIETDSTDTDFDLKDNNGDLTLSGERTADSILVKVNNPRNLHFWYTAFAGNRIIDAGQADQLFYKKAFNEQKVITFLVNYVWGGESKSEQASLVYRDDVLNINVKQPLSICPGEQVQTDIVVTDVAGKPVANTDLTAWSLTRKFNNYNAPTVPYLGRSYPYRKTKTPFETDVADPDGSIKLNWDRWSRSMGLDSIIYYQFTHAKNIYRIEEPGIDTVTQIAPFIVKNGDIIHVHILYIDERPVYFSQAEHLQQYSFMVTPGKHSIRFRTSDQNIKLDSVFVERSKKLILGINADYPPSTKVSDTLDNYEAGLINKYLVTIIDNFDQKRALLKQGDHIFFLNPQLRRNSSILTGPLSDNYALLDLQGEPSRQFIAEPGYSYLFEPGLLKQKSIAAAFPFKRNLSLIAGIDDYTQYVITQARADSIWQAYLDDRSHKEELFVNVPVTDKQRGKLAFERLIQRKEDPALIKNIIIYRYDNPDFIRIFPGNATDLGYLGKGNYRLLFLLKGDSYDIKENINIRPYGINYYKVPVTATHLKDSVSIKISNVINSRSGRYQNSDYNIENDALKIKEAFNDKYLNNDDFPGSMSGQVIGADDKLPIIGCTLKVRGTNHGIVTDVNGHFNLKVPASGKLVVSYIGYVTKEIDIEPGSSVKIALDPSHMALQEVVVVGYGVERKKDLTGSVSTVNMLQCKVSGISIVEEGAPGSGTVVHIRGTSTIPGQEPLYIVDGVIVKDLKGINLSSIGEVNVLKSAAATALYGSRAANGVVLVVTKKQSANNAVTATIQQNSEETLRKNFSDYAYWQPKLITDAQGKASFTSVFPDDITNWRTFITAINGQSQTGFKETQIKSFRPVSANFLSPQFAVKGDQINVIGKVLNYTSDTVSLNRSFSYNEKLFKQDRLKVTNSKIDTLNITAEGTDSLTFEYTIKRDNGYFDGERRKIPLIEQGVTETKGVFEALEKDTIATLKFDPALGPVTFRAEASVLPALLDETERLRNYKYLCNEQLASKLMGLLAEKKIRAFLKVPFKWDKSIQQIINKLQDNRRSQGTWGWWKDTDEELWISLHAVEALLEAEKQSFYTDIEKQKLTEYLVYQLESYKGADKLTCLQLLKKMDAKVDYQKYTDIVNREILAEKYPSRYDQFRLILLEQAAGIPVKIDSIFKMEHHTMFGNIYWGENNYRFFDNSIQLSVLAYKIIRNEGKHPELLQKIRGDFLEQRRNGEWRNTYESSLILETILPDLLTEDKQIKPSRIILSGTRNETVNKFPYAVTLAGGDLRIDKTGTLPVYITGYQQFWNSNPEKVSKDFTVSSWFEKKGKKITKLKGGEPVELKIEVTAKGDADYVMIN